MARKHYSTTSCKLQEYLYAGHRNAVLFAEVPNGFHVRMARIQKLRHRAQRADRLDVEVADAVRGRELDVVDLRLRHARAARRSWAVLASRI